LQPTHLVQILGDTRGQKFDLSIPNVGEHQEENVQLYHLPACTTMDEASLCHIPNLTWRNFRWATYFLPHMVSTFDAWNFISAKDLQTGWIAATGKHFRNDISGVDDVLKDECRLARALAKERPYCVPMEAVDCFVIGSDFEDCLGRSEDVSAPGNYSQKQDRILQALNGSIVSLCTDPTTMESLGCGILRSIDWQERLLYVLVPPSLDESSLPQVKALVGGNLPLPLAMLYRGVYSESFPYLTTIAKDLPSSSMAILGSDPMKSRNNIARRSLSQCSNSNKSDRVRQQN